MKKAKLDVPVQVIFVPIDFNHESLLDVLTRAGWQSEQKTLFTWEGVSYYLEPLAVDATLTFFSQSAASGSVIAFDYAKAMSEKKAQDSFGVNQFDASMKEKHDREAFKFLLGENQIGLYLAQRKLTLVEHLAPAEIERQYLTGDRGASIARIPGHFHFVVAAK